MPRFSALVTLFAALSAGSLFALDPHKALTQYSASIWTQQQGLPQDAVTAIAQTFDGYLWVGTDEGLARFDGYEFTSFNRAHGAPPSNSISALAAGPDGSLWIGSRGGLTRYKDGQFRTWTRKDGLIDNLVSELLVDHTGAIWIVAAGSLSRFDGMTFTSFIREKDIPLHAVRAVAESRNHEIYVCGNSSVVKLVNGRFVSIIGPEVLSADFPSQIRADRAENLWITGARGVVERLPNGALKRYQKKEGLSDNFGMNTIAEDRGGTIWVGTDWGLARFDGVRFENLPATRDGVAVRCIFEDREGNLWVGSDKGLIRYRDDPFTAIGQAEGLPDNGPIAIYADHLGTIWAGYDDGLLMMKNSHLPAIRVSDDKLFIRHLHETRAGDLLVPSRQGLIRIRNGNKTTFVAPDPQGRKTVFDAIEGSDGDLWLALPNGLAQLRGTTLDTVIKAGPLYRYDSFYVLAATPNGTIWAGTLANGLWRYHRGQKQLFTSADGLSSNQIRALHIDRAGILWIGTLDGGLSEYRDGKFFQYRVRDGLLSDNVNAITDDGESLWLSTTRGICRISRQQLSDFTNHRIKALQPVNYGVDDGLRSAQATDGLRRSDGTLWFATSGGIATYNPHAGDVTPLPPLTHILDLSTDRRSFGHTHPDLPPGPGRIQIRYTSIHLRAPDRVRYSYMIEGTDSAWANADATRTVNYDSLPHGHYRFLVKAELPGGPSNESALDFDIDPHYWETAWFRVVAVFLFAGVIMTGYKIRERQVRSRFALVLQERARLAREVHDTLAQGFVGIASQLDVVDMMMPPNAGSSRNALALARRMARHSLTEARRSLMDLRASALDDQDLAVALKSGAERWAGNSGINVGVGVEGDASQLPEEVAHHVFRIAQEAVANAVNHGGPRKINVELKIDLARLRLRVDDDGCGFEPDDAFTSREGNFGLIGMRERAERIKGELRLNSQHGKGTRVEVTVPLK